MRVSSIKHLVDYMYTISVQLPFSLLFSLCVIDLYSDTCYKLSANIPIKLSKSIRYFTADGAMQDVVKIGEY